VLPLQSSEREPLRDGGLAAASAIRVLGLTYRYPSGEQDVLHGIDLEVAPGEFVGITGASGAGKSTLCLCLKGLIPHSLAGTLGGSVVVNGLDTSATGPAQLAENVAMVFQDPESQIIGLTVAEDLAFGPENLTVAPADIRAEIPRLLETVGLAGFEHRETYSLSGGQKQRVAIAAALMLRPSILILDEPTSELDPVGKAEVFRTVRRLREESQVTVVMVEHEIEQLADVADRIIVVDGGRIVADAPPAQLFRDVELFHRTQGGRLPQVAELMLALEAEGLVDPADFTPREDEAVAVLSSLLERARQARP
jgi:energy-coupling factor transporter ATP-binding protein EcfA2